MPHSPLPWKVDYEDVCNPGVPVIVDAEGYNPMCPRYAFPDNPEDPEFIVRAVNSHEDLLAACKTLIKHLECSGDASQEIADIDNARAAIAKAEATPPAGTHIPPSTPRCDQPR